MTRHIVDLTYPIRSGMPTFPAPWHPSVRISPLGRHNTEGRETRELTLGTHTGTHCDAPRHFVEDGSTVDQIPLDVLIGPAMVIDLRAYTERREIGVRQIMTGIRGSHPERVILRFGWDGQWGTPGYYAESPFLTLAAAEALVAAGVRLLAMDTPSPDNPEHGRNSDPDSPVHKFLLKKRVVLVEYLCNLGSIQGTTVHLIVLPLRLEGADGAPARCVAIEES